MILPKSGDFSKLVADGENPSGMIAQTANGTIRNGRGGDGWTYRYPMADGPKFNTDPRPEESPLDMNPMPSLPAPRRTK